MRRESDYEPENDAFQAIEFRSAIAPELRAVTRTIDRIDGFPDKLEPRRDCCKDNGLHGRRSDDY